MISYAQYASWLIEWTLLTFHLSVSFFVAHQVFRKKWPFTTGFYKIYLMQSVFDVCNYFASSLLLRLMRHKVIPKEWLVETAFPKAQYFAVGYCSYFEYLSHTLIAYNRYSVITDQGSERKLWNGLSLIIISMVQFTLPLFIAFPRLLDYIVVTEDPETYVIRGVVEWVSVYNGIASTAITLLTCLTSFYLELRTLILYRRFNAHTKRERYEDYRLLLYAIVGLIAQLLLAVYYTFNFTIGIFYPSVFAVTQQILPYLVDLLSLYGSACLFITSGTLRRGYLRFYGLACLISTSAALPTFSSTTNI